MLRLDYDTLRLLSTGLLGRSAGSVYLFLPAKALGTGRRCVLLATILAILVGGHLGGFYRISIHGVVPVESVIVLPPVVAAILADFLEMGLAEESICDFDSCGGHD